MEHSSGYNEVEEMIRKNWVGTNLADFGRALDEMEEAGKITPEEHKALVELYRNSLKPKD